MGQSDLLDARLQMAQSIFVLNEHFVNSYVMIIQLGVSFKAASEASWTSDNSVDCPSTPAPAYFK